MDERLETMEVPLLQDPNNSRNNSNTRGRWPWKGSIFILGAKFCERMAFYGVDTNLVTYLTGVLNKSNSIAATISTTWSGTCSVTRTPLIGAISADAYLGRYRTMAVSSTLYFFGLIALTLVSALKLPATVFYLGLYVMAVGSGSFMPCTVAFGADQFDNSNPKERRLKSSFFNWFFFVTNFGTLVSSSSVVWVEDNIGWALGFGISTLMMGFAMGIFYSGTPIYRRQNPGGSPLTRICQVIVASSRKLRVQVPCDKSLLYETPYEESAVPGSRKLNYTDEFKCLDKAATITDYDRESGELCNGWRICTVTQVEEVKILIRMVPILSTAIIYASATAQAHTMFVEQGKTMDNSIGSHFKIPAASLYMFSNVTCMLWVVAYDYSIAPAMRKLKRNEKGFTELQRMGIGKLIAMLSMVCAALLETKRLQVVKSHDLVHDADTPVPLTILWQIPQYVLLGVASSFILAGQLEFYYEEAPDAMRTLCSALSHLSTAIGDYFCSLVVIVVMLITTTGGNVGWIPDNLNEGHLDYYFWLWAAFSLLNLAVYVAAASRYRCKHAAKEITYVLI